MSEPVSALNHAAYEGIARIEEVGLQGMITLRGDLSARALKSAARTVAGFDLPDTYTITGDGDGGICWMSPDELLLLCPYAAVAGNVETLQKALAKSHTLVVNVSDARAVLRVSGPATREVMAKLCPIDLSPSAFKPGMFRRTRMAQVPAALWMVDDETIQVICFRSVADYVFKILKTAAASGSEVGYF